MHKYTKMNEIHKEEGAVWAWWTGSGNRVGTRKARHRHSEHEARHQEQSNIQIKAESLEPHCYHKGLNNKLEKIEMWPSL